MKKLGHKTHVVQSYYQILDLVEENLDFLIINYYKKILIMS